MCAYYIGSNVETESEGFRAMMHTMTKVPTIAEKKRRYQPLSVELNDLFNFQEVAIVPHVVSAKELVATDW